MQTHSHGWTLAAVLFASAAVCGLIVVFVRWQLEGRALPPGQARVGLRRMSLLMLTCALVLVAAVASGITGFPPLFKCLVGLLACLVYQSWVFAFSRSGLTALFQEQRDRLELQAKLRVATERVRGSLTRLSA